MNLPDTTETQTVTEVPSLLIPMDNRVLIVPTVTVAEMVPYDDPAPQIDSPDWFLGYFSWRNITVPLLSYELINGETKAVPGSNSRIAVLNNTGMSENLPFIAIVTQGIPRLARVNAEEINEVNEMKTKPFELMHVSLAGELAVIPDIDALEKAYLDFKHMN